MIEQVFFPSICESNAVNAAADKECTRDLMAEFYADCIRASAEHGEDSINWPMLNAAITKRWPKGLSYVKTQAWRKRRPAIRRDGA